MKIDLPRNQDRQKTITIVYVVTNTTFLRQESHLILGQTVKKHSIAPAPSCLEYDINKLPIRFQATCRLDRKETTLVEEGIMIIVDTLQLINALSSILAYHTQAYGESWSIQKCNDEIMSNIFHSTCNNSATKAAAIIKGDKRLSLKRN